MKGTHIKYLSLLIALMLFTSCDSCVGGPAPTLGPGDFVGQWEITPAGSTAPISLTLSRAVNQTPTVKGDVTLEGRYGPNSLVTGNANGNVFVGNVVYGNTVTAIEMRLITTHQAAGTISRAMNARDFVGVKMR